MTQEAAEFPGGKYAWINYLSENLTYPKKLKRQKITGQVIAKIYIDSTGTISKVEIIKSLHPLLDDEVIRVIKRSPKWEPAKQNGKAVLMTFNQTINF